MTMRQHKRHKLRKFLFYALFERGVWCSWPRIVPAFYPGNYGSFVIKWKKK